MFLTERICFLENDAADAFSINSVVFKRRWTFPKERHAEVAKISLQATGKCTFLSSALSRLVLAPL